MTLFARMQATVTLATGGTSEYGLGLRRERTYRGARVLESTGSDPGYQAYLGRYPDDGLAIAVICNAGSSASPVALAHGVADEFLGAVLAPVTAVTTRVRQTGVAVPMERLQSRVGVYLQPTTLAVVRLVVRDSELAVAGGPSLVPWRRIASPSPVRQGTSCSRTDRTADTSAAFLVSDQCRSSGMSRVQPAQQFWLRTPVTTRARTSAAWSIDSRRTIPRS